MEKRVQWTLSIGEFLYIKQGMQFAAGVLAGDDDAIRAGFGGAVPLFMKHHGTLADKINSTMDALALTDEELLRVASL